MLMLFCVLAFMVINAGIYFNKDAYFVRLEDAGRNKDAMQQAIKIELETTLRHAGAIVDGTPYLIAAGNYMHCRSLVKVIEENGGTASIVRKHLFEKESKYVDGPIRDN